MFFLSYWVFNISHALPFTLTVRLCLNRPHFKRSVVVTCDKLALYWLTQLQGLRDLEFRLCNSKRDYAFIAVKRLMLDRRDSSLLCILKPTQNLSAFLATAGSRRRLWNLYPAKLRAGLEWTLIPPLPGGESLGRSFLKIFLNLNFHQIVMMISYGLKIDGDRSNKIINIKHWAQDLAYFKP